jgi:hypothetical protein
MMVHPGTGWKGPLTCIREGIWWETLGAAFDPVSLFLRLQQVLGMHKGLVVYYRIVLPGTSYT